MLKKKAQEGQASILIGMFILTFLLFFTFVVNVGMLVNAKINLQNAADLAAYAGAATQARQMTTLGILNYEMRRQYKKFLFRYYVLGSMFQDSFPGKSGQVSPGQRLYIPNPSAPAMPVPAVCVDLYTAPNTAAPGSSTAKPATQEAYCRLIDLPVIAGANASLTGIDAIEDTLTSELQQIENIREAACDNLASINETLLFLWLYNTVPEGPNPPAGSLGSAFNQNAVQLMYDRVKYLASGIGLIPREIILWMRAQTIRDWVNQPPVPNGVTLQWATQQRGTQNALMNERSISAYFSAYETLGQTTWVDTPVLEELLPTGTTGTPPGAPGANLLNLKLIHENFDTYSVGYEKATSATTAGATHVSVNDCIAKVYPISVYNLPLGFYKDTGSRVYYAVRLTATAQLLFSPFGNLKLSAYSAAMPFGSRIGPDFNGDPDPFFTYPYDTFGSNFYFSSQGTASTLQFLNGNAGTLPNLAVMKNDSSASIDQGWNNMVVQNAFWLPVPKSGEGNRMQYDALLNLAMAPNPWEAGQYIIPNDKNGDAFIRFFDSNAEGAVWAPIVEPDQQGSLDAALQSELANILKPPASGPSVTGKPSGFPTPGNLAAFITSDLTNYANRLAGHVTTGPEATEGANQADVPVHGSLHEGINVALVIDPFSVPGGHYSTVLPGSGSASVPSGSDNPYPITTSAPAAGLAAGLSAEVFVDPSSSQAIQSVRDSWNNVMDAAFVPVGRVGYSVKFVGFKSLLGFSNPPTGDSDFSTDSGLIKH